MKHAQTESSRAKKKLIDYYDFKEVDFYKEDGLWYLNCKDNVGESAWDVWREKELTFKENLEDESRDFL